MQTRIMLLIAIIGLVVLWFAGTQTDRMIALIGIGLVLVGFIGAYLSFRNKKGMGFLRRL